ncbi:hypothetical protein NP493_1482g00001 [Ridgeia piscesae]|uniref:guanylate cyclase n=1 Tax=Ridgeia piscesae TaxID=27915 RepID=A0AAD9K1M2_RIDPI|nr:hypothetical protein NP493_1482g00001 [Ridgeia piscesae]
MYGLIIEGIADAIKNKYGEEKWEEVRRQAGVTHTHFIAEKRYSETIVPQLLRAAVVVIGVPLSDIMGFVGNSFVEYVSRYGYERILRVLGRHVRDFLNGLDNLHEYLRFTYPYMKPPSFYCEDETATGLKLHYRSRRKGFLHYVIGQIRAVGQIYYNTVIEVEILKEEESLDMVHIIMLLKFDNSSYVETVADTTPNAENLLINSDVFFEVFPFHILFDEKMFIKNIGSGLMAVLPDLVGKHVDEIFGVTRPLVEFNIDNLKMYANNIFELESIDPVTSTRSTQGRLANAMDSLADDTKRKLKLKGQMLYMDDWQVIVFLATPVMENIAKMFDVGLYINDLSMHDSSRDLVLAGTQQSAELKLALDQEQQKSKVLEESMQQLDVEMKRTDELLYQMIPKAVADRLRKGEPAVNTCEVFENVTILFSDVVGFTRICSQITPMAVVSMLNGMYTSFDQLSEKNKVYKVETIGDAYMVVSGAPTITPFHPLYVANMAFDMLAAMVDLIDPSTGSHMRIRVGAHSGTVVAGVVGMKMPRYCLFGNTVNTASRMECDGEAMRINISETTKAQLEQYAYKFEDHGTIEVKGTGILKTFWLTQRPSDDVDIMALGCPLTVNAEDSDSEREGLSPKGKKTGNGQAGKKP